MKKSSYWKKIPVLCFAVAIACSSSPVFAQKSKPIELPTMAPDSALPQTESPQRSPGMDLPSSSSSSGGSSGQAVNPFAPPEKVVKTPEEIEKEIRSRAFEAAITGLLPLRPNEIRELLERYDAIQQAVEVPVHPYPAPEMVVETVSLDPGSTPPEIKVAVGHVTTINLLDITGEPWPIRDISWAGNFEVLQPERGSNIIRITPMSEFTYGNMSVTLLELKTPVIFTLKTHRDAVQYRFDARIAQFGPMAQVPIIDGGINLVAGNDALSAILDGVPPSGAEKLDVSGVDARTTAYTYNKLTYVRTPLTLLSPGWSSSVSSADGMNVYSVSSAPVLLLSDQGRVVRARLNSKDSLDDE